MEHRFNCVTWSSYTGPRSRSRSGAPAAYYNTIVPLDPPIARKTTAQIRANQPTSVFIGTDDAGFSTEQKCVYGSDGKAINYNVLSKTIHKGPPPPQIGKPGDIFIGYEGNVYFHRKVLWVDTNLDDAVLYRHPVYPDFVLKLEKDKEKPKQPNPTWVLVKDLFHPSLIGDLQDVCAMETETTTSQVSPRRPPQAFVHFEPTSLSSPQAGCAERIGSRTTIVDERGTNRTFTESGISTDNLCVDTFSFVRRSFTEFSTNLTQQIDVTLAAMEIPLAKISVKEPELLNSCPWAGCTIPLQSNLLTVFIDHALQVHILPDDVNTHTLYNT